ncbi:hypothetical protein N9857_03510 [Gammaproteobacteria bacterium]|nr:hypothetical protein [Gammaproteobacteria bacterium]MDC1377382.1 hypothetical protein [Gammaproteobacteria bacterium]MDC1470832.1 hypothetical protein [Gammaproteobacteria bacterium]|tara:strand:+ start:379 stop:600 length:222 start_codon:yes stop_codon:yes gene_type:complete
MDIFNKIIDFLNEVTRLLIPIVAVSLLLGIIFGPDTTFVGDVYKNIAEILNTIGEDAILGLISIVIILAYLKK